VIDIVNQTPTGPAFQVFSIHPCKYLLKTIMMKCSSAKKSLLRKGSIVWSFLAEFYRYWREGIWAKLCMLHLCIIVHNRAPVHLARNSMSLFLDITMVVEKSFQQTSIFSKHFCCLIQARR